MNNFISSILGAIAVAVLSVWFTQANKTPSDSGGGKGAPETVRVTPRNLPKIVLTQMIIDKIVETLSPESKQFITLTAPPNTESPGVTTIPFPPELPKDTDPTSRTIEFECFINESDNTCIERIYKEYNTYEENISIYNKIQSEFNADFKYCDEKVTGSAPLDDYMLTYDLQIYCMRNKGHGERLNRLAENSDILKARLEQLDNNEEILRSYMDN